MAINQTWSCEYCNKTVNDPNGSAEYFHSCRQGRVARREQEAN